MKHIILLGILTFLGCADDADKNQGDTPTGDMGVDTEADMNMADMDHDSPEDAGPTEPFMEKVLCKVEVDYDADQETDSTSYFVYDELGQILHRYDVNPADYFQVDYIWEERNLVRLDLYETGMPIATTSITYDELDRIILTEAYEDGELQSRVERIHDGLEETAYNDENGDGVIDYETTYVYLKRVGFFESYVFSLYERREPDGLVTERITQTYDDQERLLTSFSTTPETASLTSYTYEPDLHIAEIDRNNDGVTDQTKTWIFGEFGVTEYRHVSATGELFSTRLYDYSEDGLEVTVRFDQDGNGEWDQTQVQSYGLGSCPEPPEL